MQMAQRLNTKSFQQRSHRARCAQRHQRQARWNADLPLFVSHGNGSCGAMVNGKPVLMAAPTCDLPSDKPISIEPMRNFPVVKDLVVDIDSAMEKMERDALHDNNERNLERGFEQSKSKIAKNRSNESVYQMHAVLFRLSCCWIRQNFVALQLRQRLIATTTTHVKNRKRQRKNAYRMTDKDGVWSCSFVASARWSVQNASILPWRFKS